MYIILYIYIYYAPERGEFSPDVDETEPPDSSTQCSLSRELFRIPLGDHPLELERCRSVN